MKLTKIAFGVALAAGTMAAHADSIFFPYVVKGGSVTTVINVIDTGTAGNYYDASGNAGTGGNRLHYTLVNKAGAAALDNGAVCSEVNYFLPSSPYDLQTIDLGAHFSVAADKGVLFNDPGVNNDWKPAVSGSLTYALAQAAAAGNAVRGYMVVDNFGTTSPADLAGEAFVFEFGGGAAWGYQALQQTGENGGEFVYGTDGVFAITGNQNAISFMPLAETTTRFFVTPVGRVPGTSNHPNTNPQYGGLTTNVALKAGTSPSSLVGVAYDRDENLVSGTVPTTVTCVGAVDVGSLMSVGAAAVLEKGGWGYLEIASTAAASTVSHSDTGNFVTTTVNGASVVVEGHSAGAGKEWVNQASVIKLEFNAAGVFNGQSTSGTYNNAFQLRSPR